MSKDWLGKIRRGLRRPPSYILRRTVQEGRTQAERVLGPRRAARTRAAALAMRAGHADVDAWWSHLRSVPFLAPSTMDPAAYETLCPGDTERVLEAARRAMAHRVELLGSEEVELGPDPDWHLDHKSGRRWPPQYCHDIEYNNQGQPSDVKVPWEISRFQWVLPLGQAYILTGDERYAAAARRLLESWTAENPYAGSVNWSCTMEPALRIFTWSWLFHACAGSQAWSDRAFRASFLRTLYLHVDFTSRHLEISDINGNHYAADAAGLVVGGLFFDAEGAPGEWAEKGWELLLSEFPLQVFDDGVDFEASVPYHRLVQELFLLPAIFRLRAGKDVPDWYGERLVRMAEFTAAYTKPNGLAPLWGDADDARALPMGPQELNDHRYLLGIVGSVFGSDKLLASAAGSAAEAAWILGVESAGELSQTLSESGESVAFRDGGFFILRHASDHVFVDCGPVGLGGRGGHGHNDLLSFEAVLDGVTLVSDRGAYLYTADYEARNRFRSTASHNTPQIDGQEVNRFIRPDWIWLMHDDAEPRVHEVSFRPDESRLVVGHGGFERLPSPVTVRRSFVLSHERHRLEVADQFEGEGERVVRVPLHLAPGVACSLVAPDEAELVASGRRFRARWSSEAEWTLEVEESTVSPAYGVLLASQALVATRSGSLSDVTLVLEPMGGPP